MNSSDLEFLTNEPAIDQEVIAKFHRTLRIALTAENTMIFGISKRSQPELADAEVIFSSLGDIMNKDQQATFSVFPCALVESLSSDEAEAFLCDVFGRLWEEFHIGRADNAQIARQIESSEASPPVETSPERRAAIRAEIEAKRTPKGGLRVRL